MQSLFGRFIGATVMGASAGFLGWLFFSSVIAGIVVAILAFFVSLFGSSGGGISMRRPWRLVRQVAVLAWAEVAVASGGGGFGGGGGGFGGGGASGRW